MSGSDRLQGALLSNMLYSTLVIYLINERSRVSCDTRLRDPFFQSRRVWHIFPKFTARPLLWEAFVRFLFLIFSIPFLHHSSIIEDPSDPSGLRLSSWILCLNQIEMSRNHHFWLKCDYGRIREFFIFVARNLLYYWTERNIFHSTLVIYLINERTAQPFLRLLSPSKTPSFPNHL